MITMLGYLQQCTSSILFRSWCQDAPYCNPFLRQYIFLIMTNSLAIYSIWKPAPEKDEGRLVVTCNKQPDLIHCTHILIFLPRHCNHWICSKNVKKTNTICYTWDYSENLVSSLRRHYENSRKKPIFSLMSSCIHCVRTHYS